MVLTTALLIATYRQALTAEAIAGLR